MSDDTARATTPTTTTSSTRSVPRATASTRTTPPSGGRALAVTEYVTRNLADDPDAIEVDVEGRR